MNCLLGVDVAFEHGVCQNLRRGPGPRPSERAIERQTERAGNGCGRLFSVGGETTPRGAPRGGPGLSAFTSRDKIAGRRHPPLRFGSSGSLRSAGPLRLPLFGATKAAMGAVDLKTGKRHDHRTRRDQL